MILLPATTAATTAAATIMVYPKTRTAHYYYHCGDDSEKDEKTPRVLRVADFAAGVLPTLLRALQLFGRL